MKTKKPSETISRGAIGEIVVPLRLPADLVQLTQEWDGLAYEQKIAAAKKRPLEHRLRLVQSVGGICKTAIQLVRDFRPLIEVCRDELSQPGCRAPIEGKPTWTEFISATFGFSPRRMQQLLSDNSPSPKVSKPATGPAKTRAATDSNDYGGGEQVVTLAVKLARSVVGRGLADEFPEATAILNIVDSKGKTQPSKADRSTEGHHVPVAQGNNEALLPTPTARIENAAAQAPDDDGTFLRLPGCYVCGTGIEFCTVHEPQHKKLMAERGLDDLDAADLLQDQYAKRIREFSKAA